MVLTLTVEQLGFAYGAKEVLRDVTLPPVRSGEVTALVGPNAAGKSTLLKCVAGIEEASGTVTIGQGGDRTAAPPPRTSVLDRLRGRPTGDDLVLYMPQDLPPSSSLTVFEAVLLARQQRRPARVSRAVTEEIERTLEQVGIEDLSLRALTQLSGGQRQMVSLAQAVVRRPSVLLLDEPTSNLDLRNQLQILELIGRIATEQPAAVLVIVHDLSLVARFADQAVVMDAGTVHSSGPPETVITEEMLREIYRIDATVQRTGDGVLTLAASRSL